MIGRSYSHITKLQQKSALKRRKIETKDETYGAQRAIMHIVLAKAEMRLQLYKTLFFYCGLGGQKRKKNPQEKGQHRSKIIMI